MKKNHEIIELDVQPGQETANAVMVKNLKGESVWLPKSLVEVDGDGIQIPQWLAEEKGLI